MINEELKAEYLDINKPFVKNVKYQKYYTCSMLTPNLFPFDKRKKAKETNVFGFKLHGVYETCEEQMEHSEKLRNIVKNYEILGDKIGELVEFDVDLADTSRNSKIVYKEEEQNEINSRQFKNEVSEKYFENNEIFNFEKDISDFGNVPNFESDEKFEDKNEMLVWKIKEAKFACVSFYTNKSLTNLNENEKEKEIVAHIVHGFFEKNTDAQKFAYVKREKYPRIFIFQVGYWCAFDKVLSNNLNSNMEAIVERNKKLNDYMKYYMDCLENTAMEEKIRRDEYLKDATVVTEEYKHLKNNLKKCEPSKDENNRNDENNENNEFKKDEISEEDKIKNKLEEIRLMKEQLNERLIEKTVVSEEEMELKFQKMRDMYEILQN
jgi:hypothetical protein